MKSFFCCATFSWFVYQKSWRENIDIGILRILDGVLQKIYGNFLKKQLSFSKLIQRGVGCLCKDRKTFFVDLFESFGVLSIIFPGNDGEKKAAFVENFLPALDYIQPHFSEYDGLIKYFIDSGVLLSNDKRDAVNKCEGKLNSIYGGIANMQFALYERNLLRLHDCMAEFDLEGCVSEVIGFLDSGGFDAENLQPIKGLLDQILGLAGREKVNNFIEQTFKPLIAKAGEVEVKLKDAKNDLTNILADDFYSQIKVFYSASQRYHLAKSKASSFLENNVLLPGRFDIFSSKHLDNGRIYLDNRLDRFKGIPAASAYYDEKRLLIAFQDIVAHEKKLKKVTLREFKVEHAQVVGISVLRGPVENGEENIDMRRVVECNASSVRIGKGGRVEHIYPCYIPPDNSAQVQAGQHTAGPSTSAGPIHPTVAAHLREQLPTSISKSNGGKTGKR